jgi:hypothetical protein
VERVEKQRQIAVAQLPGAPLVAGLNSLQLLKDQGEIADFDLGT